MSINTFPGGVRITGSSNIPGTKQKVGTEGNEHNLPVRKKLTLNHGFTPKNAQKLRDDEAKSWDALSDLVEKEKTEGLTTEEKKIQRSAEQHLAVDGDLLNADASWDKKHSNENNGYKYTNGKLEHFQEHDETVGLLNAIA